MSLAGLSWLAGLGRTLHTCAFTAAFGTFSFQLWLPAKIVRQAHHALPGPPPPEDAGMPDAAPVPMDAHLDAAMADAAPAPTQTGGDDGGC